MKVFNYSELHFLEVTPYKIHTLATFWKQSGWWKFAFQRHTNFLVSYYYSDLEPSEQNFVNVKGDSLDQSVQFRYYNPLLTLIGGQNNSTLQGSTRTPASSFETGMKSAKPTPITSAQNSTQSSRTMSSFDVKSGKPTPSTSAQNSPMSLARICRSPTVNHPG